MTVTLKAELLTSERFAPYGEVIEASRESSAAMNDARFDRFDDLCNVDIINDGAVAVSIARCRTPTQLPLRIDMVERHPLGSQAFVPLGPCRMVIVVAPPGEGVNVDDLRAFVTNGRQGFNYRRGTWHMPLVGFDEGQEYLVIDRSGNEPNCETHMIDDIIFVEAD
ncbi:MAG: ureidoglycolate lyase [Pseudomonadota bacterium]